MKDLICYLNGLPQMKYPLQKCPAAHTRKFSGDVPKGMNGMLLYLPDLMGTGARIVQGNWSMKDTMI